MLNKKELDFAEDSNFEKVIFLDIDGVLNSECTRGYFKHIEEEYVKNLAYIVENTSAKIVITSSWRRLMSLDIAKEKELNVMFTVFGEQIELLLTAFRHYGLHIEDYTSISNCDGYESRPFEIRKWLSEHNVDNFVVLDDDFTYHWGFLEKYLVCTCVEIVYNNKVFLVKGLTKGLADIAINKLNN